MDMKELFKSKKKIGDNERDAKMSVLKEVSDMAGSAMGDKLKGLKKVSVMAPDSEHLKEGLDSAKKLVDKMPDGSCPECKGAKGECSCPEMEGSDAEESAESPEFEASEDESSEEKDPEQMDAEELKAKIEELKQLLAHKE